MSDHYHYTLDFKLRRDTPLSLISALRALSRGQAPAESDLAALPALVATYLRSGDFTGGPEGLPSTRLWPFGMVYRSESPGDAIWELHYERVFHDDEFWNGGMYLIWWLFQFAAQQGHLATMLLEFDSPPEVYTKIGGDVVTTTLSYNPETYQALDFRDAPLDPDRPIAVARTTRTPLLAFLKDIAFMADDEGQAP